MPKLSGQSMVCDASSLISLTDSCFVGSLYFLKKKYKGRFLIPPSVEYECVTNPMRLRAHALHALRLKLAIKDGIIDVVEPKSQKRAYEIRWLSNSIFYVDGAPLRLLHEGEAEVLALSLDAGVENLLMDERTTRMLCEDPESLRVHLEAEFKKPVSTDEGNLSAFSRAVRGMRFFRSSELLLLAAEKGFFKDYRELEQETVEAALYRLKYAGCAVGFGEIDGYLVGKGTKRRKPAPGGE